jgi:hypothetical protein
MARAGIATGAARLYRGAGTGSQQREEMGEMARYRRWRWIAIVLPAVVVLGTLLVTAEAWADRGAARCASSAPFAAQGDSWRTGALAAASCHAWRQMRRHEHGFLTRLDNDRRIG